MIKLKDLFYRLKIKLGLEKENGFSTLYYKGLPVIQRDDFPANKVGFLNAKTGYMKVLDIKTGKITKKYYGKFPEKLFYQ